MYVYWFIHAFCVLFNDVAWGDKLWLIFPLYPWGDKLWLLLPTWLYYESIGGGIYVLFNFGCKFVQLPLLLLSSLLPVVDGSYACPSTATSSWSWDRNGEEYCTRGWSRVEYRATGTKWWATVNLAEWLLLSQGELSLLTVTSDYAGRLIAVNSNWR